jgi:two-component system LytT family response regulator
LPFVYCLFLKCYSNSFISNTIFYICYPKLKPMEETTSLVVAEKQHEEKFEKEPEKIYQLLKILHHNFKKIKLCDKTGYTLENVKEIVRLEADGNYTKVHFSDGRTLLLCKTLKLFEDSLCELNFCRVHDKHLINLNHVKKVLKTDGGCVVMSNTDTVPISQSKRNAFDAAMDEFAV